MYNPDWSCYDHARGDCEGGYHVQFVNLLPILLLLGLMYFMMIRPQQQSQKKRQAMLNAINSGMEVVTIGGLHGTVTAINDTTVTLRVAEDVELTFNRSAIGSVKEGQS
jgi:preprotein translocase subunit YajC